MQLLFATKWPNEFGKIKFDFSNRIINLTSYFYLNDFDYTLLLVVATLYRILCTNIWYAYTLFGINRLLTIYEELVPLLCFDLVSIHWSHEMMYIHRIDKSHAYNILYGWNRAQNECQKIEVKKCKISLVI